MAVKTGLAHVYAKGELVSCYESFANVPLIGAAGDLAVAAAAIGTAIASAIARLRT